jgi:hypothetical protein
MLTFCVGAESTGVSPEDRLRNKHQARVHPAQPTEIPAVAWQEAPIPMRLAAPAAACNTEPDRQNGARRRRDRDVEVWILDFGWKSLNHELHEWRRGGDGEK